MRQFLCWLHRRLAIVLACVALLVPRSGVPCCTPGPSAGPPVHIGVTFSQHEAEYRSLAWQQAFHNVLQAAPALVRIAAYWNEMEPAAGTYDFATLDWLLDQASQRQQKVVLTFGMKAPRWPEFYLPAWLKADLSVPDGGHVSSDPRVRVATLEFLRSVVQHVRDSAVIVAWQVENEPLDAAGPHRWSIEPRFLAQEVSLVRQLDPHDRRVIVNAFVETQPLAQVGTAREALLTRARTALAVADVLGLDVYPGRTVRVVGHELSVRWPAWMWSDILSQLRTLATRQGKDAWIVEGQAEPWTNGGKAPPPAWPGAVVDPSSVTSSMSRFQSLGYTTVLLWGAEHWENERNNRDDRWWSAMSGLFAAQRSNLPPIS
jgi:Beta-galactosidase